ICYGTEMSTPPSKANRYLSPPVAAVLIAAGFVLVYLLSTPLLLVFAGILLAVVLDVATLGLGRLMRQKRQIRLALVTTIFILIAGIGILAGGVRLVNEAQNLLEITSKQADLLIERLESMGLLKAQDDPEDESPSTLLDYLPDPGQIFGHARTTIGATLGAATNMVIILF